VDRFLFEPFESDLALLVSLETRIGMSMLDSAILKLVRVDRTTSKLAERLWSILSRAIAGFFLRRTLLTGLAFIVTIFCNETSAGPGESYDEGVLLVDTSCSTFLSKALTAASKLSSWDAVEGHVESSTLSEELLVGTWMPLFAHFEGVQASIRISRALSGLNVWMSSSKDASLLIEVVAPVSFLHSKLKPVMSEYTCDLSVLIEM
jgi:hypothetical protein